MRQKTTPKTKAQIIGAFCYNCVYSVVAAACCAMAFDTHQPGKWKATQILSHTKAMWHGGICTFFCLLLLFFLWRQWWRDVQTV